MAADVGYNKGAMGEMKKFYQMTIDERRNLLQGRLLKYRIERAAAAVQRKECRIHA